MLKVFISWSGLRSEKTALTLKKYLPLFIHQIVPWMSKEDIYKGDRWAREIGENLHSHDLGIICVTPENRAAPWLLFESGALSKQFDRARVFPLLLGMEADDIEGPLSQFQATILVRRDFKAMLKAINALLAEDGLSDRVLDETFDSFWPKMEAELVKLTEVRIEGTALNIANVTSAFGKYGLPEPTIGNHVYFSSGFESHTVYSSAYELAHERLWIWGRKNRKAFDKDHEDFFSGLQSKIANGFDFRVLFLDPKSDRPILSIAHRDDDFPAQLDQGLKRARSVCSDYGVQFSEVARAYNGLRNTGIVIVDDAVLYSPIQYDKDGCVEPLTKAPFSVVGLESKLGLGLKRSFLSCWKSSRKFNA